VVPAQPLSDEQLVAALGEALRAEDPVPPELLAAAKATWTWRTIDADLAELVADSALEGAAVRGPAGAATATGPRILTFAVGALTLVVEVAEQRDRRRLLGQIVPPRRADVELDHAAGTVTVAADELGRFRVEDFPTGPVRLSLRFPDDPGRVVTSWVTV
jgi:hypothetical protein